MGLDLLDMAFRLERRFKVTLPKDVWESRLRLSGRGVDLTAWDVAEVVAERLRTANVPTETSGADEPASSAGFPVLGYGSAADPAPSPADGVRGVWPGVRDVLCEVLGCHPIDVRPESRLRADLGME